MINPARLGALWAGGQTIAEDTSTTVTLPVPISSSLYYTGDTITPTWIYNSSRLQIGGDIRATEVGIYYTSFTPLDGYTWSDTGTNEARYVTWEIKALVGVATPTLSSVLYQYTGNVIVPEWENYDSAQLSISGDVSATDVGTYKTSFTPREGYCWSDTSTAETRSVSWTIKEYIVVTLPSLATYTYECTESMITPKWSDYDSTKVKMSGDTSATWVGTYATMLTPLEGYCWSDNSTGTKTVNWTIYTNNTIADIEWTGEELTYSGSSQSIPFTYSTTYFTVTGTTSATNAGEYVAYFTPKSGYCWPSGYTGMQEITWYINYIIIDDLYYADTYNEGTYVYDGTTFVHPFTSETPAIRYILDGDLGGTNAGEYVLLATPATNCCWSDGSTEQREYYWYINKALCEVTVTHSPDIHTLTLYGSDDTTSFGVNLLGDGNVYVDEWAQEYFSITSSRDSVSAHFTFTGRSDELYEGDVYFYIEEGTNYYYEPSAVYCHVANIPVGETLNDTSWEAISRVSTLGRGSSLWSVGDSKEVLVDGYIGTVYDNCYYWAYILGFNHNSDIEGAGIHFQMAKTKESGDLIAFDDENGFDFYMNEEETNMTNWSGSYMRNTYCSDFYNCLSSDEVFGYIKPITKCTGMGGAYTPDIEFTDELVFIPSEYEVFGSVTYSSAEEAAYQQKYSFFSSSSSRIRYSNYDINSETRWWLRSPDNTSSGTSWCAVATSGNASSRPATNAYAFAPCFVV